MSSLKVPGSLKLRKADPNRAKNSQWEKVGFTIGRNGYIVGVGFGASYGQTGRGDRTGKLGSGSERCRSFIPRDSFLFFCRLFSQDWFLFLTRACSRTLLSGPVSDSSSPRWWFWSRVLSATSIRRRWFSLWEVSGWASSPPPWDPAPSAPHNFWRSELGSRLRSPRIFFLATWE